MRRAHALLLAGLTIVCAPSHLAAQAQRGGFFIGVGFGVGSLGVQDATGRESAPSGYFKLGGAINDKVLLGAETNGWIKSASEGGANVTISSSSLSAVAYVYPSPTSGFFLKGGVGLARLDLKASAFGLSFNGAEDGTAVTVGLGYDIGFGGRFALTPYTNVVHSSFQDGSTNLFQIGLGVNWY